MNQVIFQDPVDKTWWYEDLEGKLHGPYSSEARAQERYQDYVAYVVTVPTRRFV